MDPITQQGLAGAAGGGGASGPLYVDDVFSTFLYEGNSGSTQTITNNIDLSGSGGLVWIKNRDATDENTLIDTERGSNKYLMSHSSNAEATNSAQITSFNSDGFSLGVANQVNRSGNDFVSWSFRKAPGFFDVVTWSGDNTDGRNISHSLGSTPGMILFKPISSTGGWYVHHRSHGFSSSVILNSSSDASFGAACTATSSTTMTVNSTVNASGTNYVAYVFAHDDQSFGTNEDEAIIKCGSYTGTGSSYSEIDVGFEPQFVLFKNTSASSTSWYMMDSMRGFTADGVPDHYIFADSTAAEGSASFMYLTSSGFGFTATGAGANASGNTYIYMAIRRPHKPPTAGTDVLDVVNRTNTSPNLFSTALSYVDAAWNKINSTGGDWMISQRLTGSYWMRFNQTNSESHGGDTNLEYDYNFKVNPYWWANGTANNYLLKRAPGFFDVVTYRGTGSAHSQSHNLEVAPELQIIKGRTYAGNWVVLTTAIDGSFDYLYLNSSDAAGNSAGTAPTSTSFSLTTSPELNTNTKTYIAYLFASLAGISKVGTYSGTGNNVNVDCGFTAGARFVLIKRTDSTGDWYVFDSTSGIVSGNDPHLFANTTGVLQTSSDFIDPLNAGFTVTSSAPAGLNASGGTYLFLAIA